MKRATRRRLHVATLYPNSEHERDILASDAKQRATIRDLKARLKAVERLALEFVELAGSNNNTPGPCETALRELLKSKNWRKP